MKQILIVEDNYIMRLFLVNYFNTEFDVEAVEKPWQALECLKSGHFDMVLMDNHEENSKDEKDLKSMVELLQWEKIPNILITNTEQSSERIKAFKIGVEDTISKPFNPVELNLRVKCRTGMLSSQAKNVA